MTSITHIISGLNVGGAERALYTLVTNGLEGPFRNQVISLTKPGYYGPLLEQAGIPVISLNMNPRRPTLGALRRLISAVSATETKILQGWMLHGNLASTLAGHFVESKTAVIWNQRRSLDTLKDISCLNRALIRLEAMLSGSPRAIVYNSARSLRQFAEHGYDDQRSVYLPNGFDTNKWAPDVEARRTIRQEFGLPPNVFVVGYVGRRCPEKDLANLYTAFKLVSPKHPNAVLVAVGCDLDQGYRHSDNVIFTGQREDVPALMCAFDLLCLSSRTEGFPNVIGEAMATGLPCVTTDVGDAADIVGDTGWVAPPQNSDRLADCLEAALSCSADELRDRGTRARSRIKSEFSIAPIVDQYLSLYRSVLSNSF